MIFGKTNLIRHCERSEAISNKLRDCFSRSFLAMTILFFLFSCTNKEKETSLPRIFPDYHYALDSIVKTKEGIVSGVELGQNIKYISLAQIKLAVDKAKDHITYEQKIDSLTRYSINYSFENDTISEIEVLINSNSQDEGDKILNDLKKYYTTKYTAPIMDKGYFVYNCFDSKKKNFTISLTDNGGASTSAIELLIYREK